MTCMCTRWPYTAVCAGALARGVRTRSATASSSVPWPYGVMARLVALNVAVHYIEQERGRERGREKSTSTLSTTYFNIIFGLSFSIFLRVLRALSSFGFGGVVVLSAGVLVVVSDLRWRWRWRLWRWAWSGVRVSLSASVFVARGRADRCRGLFAHYIFYDIERARSVVVVLAVWQGRVQGVIWHGACCGCGWPVPYITLH